MTAAITIHFRDPSLTQGCVDSLLADGWAPVLIWDNSADGGATLQQLHAYYVGDSRVLLADNPSNLGFGKGMNAALAELGRLGNRGPVLLVNNDARVLPGMRATLKAHLPSAAKPTLIAPRIRQDGQKQGWLYYQPWLALVTRRRFPGSFAYLSGCCLLVQRPDNALPLFDEDFFMYGEDVELSWRVREQGGRLVLLDEAWVEHKGSASSGRASEAYERFLVRSHWLLASKLTSSEWIVALMCASRVPSMVLRACLRSLRYRSLVPFRALSALWQLEG